jgi:4-amino-4-deoxy-L-arabinose transferase-like glycosyltransferase
VKDYTLPSQPSIRAHGWGLPTLLLIALFVIISTPFLGKAYHIDDPLFLWSAKQILAHPTDFYRFSVNWYGPEMPAYLVIKNPPLASYYIAAVAHLFGWQELFLHCSFLFPAIVAVVGAYRLARYFCSSPLLAASITAVTPLFMVSSTTVMCDVMMLSLWIWALEFWILGITRNKHYMLYVASFTAALCALSKYIGVSLIPLFFIFALAHRRNLGVWVFPMLIIVLILWWYEHLTRGLYGIGLLSEAVSYSSQIRNIRTNYDVINMLIGFSFLGGCLINVLIFSPILWRKLTIIGGISGSILLIFLLPLFGSLGSQRLIDASGVKWSMVIHLGIFLVSGLSFVLLSIMDFLNNRDEYGLILFAWVIGIFAFAAAMNWTINARSFLPLAPVAGILVVRRLERLRKASTIKPTASVESVQGGVVGGSGENVTPGNWLYASLSRIVAPRLRIAPLFSLMVLMAVSVTWADYRLANTARDAAIRIGKQYVKEGRTLWFQGHWGFQYYMEKEGAKPLDINRPMVAPGDILVMPSNNTNVYAINKNQISLIDTIKLIPASWITTMSPALGAGFYWDAKGPLPFAVGCVPPEEYYVFQLQNLPDP